jgi:hypothetical protein
MQRVQPPGSRETFQNRLWAQITLENGTEVDIRNTKSLRDLLEGDDELSEDDLRIMAKSIGIENADTIPVRKILMSLVKYCEEDAGGGVVAVVSSSAAAEEPELGPRNDIHKSDSTVGQVRDDTEMADEVERQPLPGFLPLNFKQTRPPHLSRSFPDLHDQPRPLPPPPRIS